MRNCRDRFKSSRVLIESLAFAGRVLVFLYVIVFLAVAIDAAIAKRTEALKLPRPAHIGARRQRMENNPGDRQNYGEMARNVTILLWTLQRTMPFRKTPIQNDRGTCFITRERAAINSSDAVLLEWLPLAYDKGPTIPRPHGALWVYFSMESPRSFQAQADRNFGAPDRWINVLMSYDPSADIVISYGKVFPRTSAAPKIEVSSIHNDSLAKKRGVLRPHSSSAEELREDENLDILRRKTKLMVVVQSNCNSALRNARMNELQQHVPFDVMGRCGATPLPQGCRRGERPAPHRVSCMKMIGEQYKFYLALENADCKDYITEKVWQNSLLADMVPVVWSVRTNMSEHLPPGSFINIADFPNAAAAAKHILYVGQHIHIYARYLRWRRHYRVVPWPVAYDIALCQYVLAHAGHEKPSIRVTELRARHRNCVE